MRQGHLFRMDEINTYIIIKNKERNKLFNFQDPDMLAQADASSSTELDHSS